MITPIATEFRSGGFELRQIRREGRAAIYEQRKGGVAVSYEVVEIQERPAETIMGRKYEAREAYPSNEDWGKCAWTCGTRERAEERFAGLLAITPP